MGAIIRWILTAIRDFLNGQIDPSWQAKQEQLQQDAAAHQRAHAETEKVNAELESKVAQNDAAIVADEKVAQESEVRRLTEKERIDKADDLKDLWFPEQ